jgi:hypothetical protein
MDDLAALQQARENALARMAELLRSASVTRAQMVRAHQRIMEHATKALDENAAVLQSDLTLLPYDEYADLNDPQWRRFNGTPAGFILRDCRLGTTQEAGLLNGERGIGALPWCVPLLTSKGPIIIRCDLATRSLARARW